MVKLHQILGICQVEKVTKQENTGKGYSTCHQRD